MRLVLLIFITIFICSCNNKKAEPVIDRMEEWSALDGNQDYFFDDSTRMERAYLEKEASHFLFVCKEPILRTYSGNGEFIRFTWLRSFENPVVIRLNIFPDSAYLTIKEAKEVIGGPIVLARDTSFLVREPEANDIRNRLLNSGYLRESYETLTLSKDGATWFLEYKSPAVYKVISRWDDGTLDSEDINKYISPLINLAEQHVNLLSKRR